MVWSRPPSACSEAPGPGAILGVDPMPDDVHLEARGSRRVKPAAQPALALTRAPPDAAL